MSQALQMLGLTDTTSPQTVQFDQWVDTLIPVAGTDGIPDQVAQPAAAQVFLNGVRDATIRSSYMRPAVYVADSNLEVTGELHGELSASTEEIMDDTGKCSITILFDNWLVDWMTNQTLLFTDLHLIIDAFPNNPNWRSRWGGKITEIHVKQDERGVHSVELVALSFREHAKKLLVAANPIFPPEVQLPRMWVLPGPIRTICAVTALVNLARIFMPIWSGITNALNPLGWINPLGPDALLNFLPTEWPIQVAFVNSAIDQSRWSTIGATWTDWHTTFKDLLHDGGIMMRAYTYMTTVTDSPNTELVDLIMAAPELAGLDNAVLREDVVALCAPKRNCVVFAFENVSGVTGPTGTAADGLINTIAVTFDDLITPVMIDVNSGNTYDPGQILDGEPMISSTGFSQTYVTEQLFDVAPGPPKVVWWDGEFTGLINSDLTWHKGAVKTTMTGSKSPIIVNQAQTFGIRYALSQLQLVLTEGLFENVGQAPVGAGLDNLYQGQLDNTLLAWQRFTDPIKALYTGDLAWQEHFEQGTGTAYTLASVLTLRSGDWKTRAWNSFTAVTHNGYPWIADSDYSVGDRLGFEANGIVWVDNCYSIKRAWSWDNYLDVQVKIGDDRLIPDPFALAFKTIANAYALLGQIAGEGTIFG